MDDLISGVFALTVVAAIVLAAIAVALAMVAAGTIFGSIVALAQGGWAFGADFVHSLASRGGSRRAPRAPEPAFELYVLGQLQRDLRQALETGWTALQRVRRLCSAFADRHGRGPTLPLGVGAVIGGYLGTGVATVMGGVVSLPVVFLSLLSTGGAWALVGLLRAADALRRRIRGASYECPVDHERFALPVYVCPACGGEHQRLVPGRWGIVRRECACGETALPTMVLNGRQRVPQRCPSGHPMSGLIGFAGRVGVPIVAGPRAGKSSYLAAAMLELEQMADEARLALNVVSESRLAYDEAVTGLRSGVVPAKTGTAGNPALVTEVQGSGRSRVLYAYDVAGESYGAADEVRGLRFLEAPSGLILLVDPFALPDVAAEYTEQLARDEDAVRPSPENPMRTLERTAAALAEAGFETRKLPLAVVICKVDAFGLSTELEDLRAEHRERAPREWLHAHGAGNLVRALEHDFRDVGWFSSSALGRLPRQGDARPFTPQGAAAPLLWVLERNGVTVARTAFRASKDAERLSSAAAATDFPPISRLGWALRVATAALPLAAVLGALGFAIVSALPSGGSHTASADVNANKASSAPATMRRVSRRGFTIAVPAEWKAISRDAKRHGYRESRWRPRRKSRVTLIVDFARPSHATAHAAAARVRARYRGRVRSYHQLGFHSIHLGRRAGWEWTFDLRGMRKVDVFVRACGAGYAVLGQAPKLSFRRYRTTFRRAAGSLHPRCQG